MRIHGLPVSGGVERLDRRRRSRGRSGGWREGGGEEEREDAGIVNGSWTAWTSSGPSVKRDSYAPLPVSGSLVSPVSSHFVALLVICPTSFLLNWSSSNIFTFGFEMDPRFFFFICIICEIVLAREMRKECEFGDCDLDTLDCDSTFGKYRKYCLKRRSLDKCLNVWSSYCRLFKIILWK